MPISVKRAFPPALCVFTSLLFLNGCDDNVTADVAENTIPTVLVETVHVAPLALSTVLPGRTVASRTAEIRPQVSGIILSRKFTEGSDVSAGQALYNIDAARFHAAADSARAALVLARARNSLSRATLSRYELLGQQHYISQQDLDGARADARASRAAIETATADLHMAMIDLEHSTVTSPINGRVGRSEVTEGALVLNGQTMPLATVQQLDPIFVDITQPGSAYLQLRQALRDGHIQAEKGITPVHILVNDGAEPSLSGTLAFSDITVDETTGSLTLRAVIPNPEHRLLPGMFVRARLDEGTVPDALQIPQQAILRTPRGDASVWVVDSDNRVHSRMITAVETAGDRWQVTDGLRPGDKIVISGSQHIKSGERVIPHENTVHDNATKNASQD